MITGLRLALSWLTVVPISGSATVDRKAAAKAIAVTPIVGALLGGAAAAVLWLLLRVGLVPILAGLIVVALLALSTRGMHVDGLADTFDGLGCYGPPERAREVMRSGGAGPFGVATIVVSIGAQSISLGVLGSSSLWIAVVVAVTAGRVAVVAACRRGTPPASDTGFGSLVAGTQPLWAGVAWAAALIAASVPAVAGRWWQGPLVVLVALSVAVVLVRHCVRRFGGLSGDVLGAAVEVTVCVAAIGLTLAV